MNIMVLLSVAEKNAIIQNARERNNAHDTSASRRMSEVFDDDELDIIGALGEAAAAYYCRAEYDSEIRPGGDAGVDFQAGGASYAVKFNHRQDGYLMVEERPGDTNDVLVDLPETVDYLISTTGLCHPPHICRCRNLIEKPLPVGVVIGGWLSRDDFMALRDFRDWGFGGRWIVGQGSLRDPREIPIGVLA
jgi:hypothetical protein